MAATRVPAYPAEGWQRSLENELADVRWSTPTLFQSQYARKQCPTRTGRHGVAIDELDPVVPYTWGGAALPWRRARWCCATSRATDEYHSSYKSKLVEAQILLPKNILFAAMSSCAHGALFAKHSLRAGMPEYVGYRRVGSVCAGFE